MQTGPWMASCPVALWDGWHMQSSGANEEQWRGSQEGLASKLPGLSWPAPMSQGTARLACHKASANLQQGTLWWEAAMMISYCFHMVTDLTENSATEYSSSYGSPSQAFSPSPKLACTHTHSVSLSLGFDRGVRQCCSGLGSVSLAWASDWMS